LDMSTPASSSPSLHPTRRQLDELDALMERMLELPVDSAVEKSQDATSDSTSSNEPSADASPFAEFSATGFESYQTDDSDPSLVASPRAFDFSSSSSAPENLFPSAQGSQEHAPFVYQTPIASGIHGQQSHAGPFESRPSVDDDAPPPIWLWPVAGINQLYDTLMGGLGSPGRILLGTGRTWLGWIGFMMLAAALAWGILDWIHWAG
jgi:hypothetical protein